MFFSKKDKKDCFSPVKFLAQKPSPAGRSHNGNDISHSLCLCSGHIYRRGIIQERPKRVAPSIFPRAQRSCTPRSESPHFFAASLIFKYSIFPPPHVGFYLSFIRIIQSTQYADIRTLLYNFFQILSRAFPHFSSFPVFFAEQKSGEHFCSPLEYPILGAHIAGLG